MSATTSDAEYLKHVYTMARNKYKPRHISTLLVAEAPPCNLDRFFYFEDVKHKTLFSWKLWACYTRRRNNVT